MFVNTMNHSCFSLLALLAMCGVFQAALSCPQGDVAEKILLHFQPQHPKGIPGLDSSKPLPLWFPLHFGPITLKDIYIGGLNETVLENFSIHAHLFKGSMEMSFPYLRVDGVYEIPGLWWTTTGNFSLLISDVKASINADIAVLHDSCFYITDFQDVISKGNFSYSTGGLLDDAGMLDLFFDDLMEVLVNITKPSILEMINTNIRYSLTTFLPPDSPIPEGLSPLEPILDPNNNLESSDIEYMENPRPVIPSHEEQKEALVRFVRYQIPWMLGDPLLLPDVTLNFINFAELHNMSVHNLKQVTQVQHLSLVYNGQTFTIETRMLHEGVFNRHKVLWFPEAFFRRWQDTEAHLGLVKHNAVLELDRGLTAPPRLVTFFVRPVVFNPLHEHSTVRGLSRMARKLLDLIQSEFGDKIRAFLYSPILSKANRILRSVDPKQLIRNFVCYAAGYV